MCSWLIGSSPTQHGVDLVEVALGQPVHDAAHALLGEAAHLEQPRLERLELFLEMSYDAFHPACVSYPKRPVT